jgi:hypothetical protein
MIVSDPRDRGEKTHAADKVWYFGANKVGFNQILNMYMPALFKDANHQLQQSINGLVHINMLLYLL